MRWRICAFGRSILLSDAGAKSTGTFWDRSRANAVSVASMNRRSPDYVESDSSIRLRSRLFSLLNVVVLVLAAWMSVTDSSPWSPLTTAVVVGAAAYPLGVLIFYTAPSWGRQLKSGFVVSAFSGFLAYQMLDWIDPATVREAVVSVAMCTAGLALIGWWAARAERRAESRNGGP
jgi:FtsH-binding integral membrane protein